MISSDARRTTLSARSKVEHLVFNNPLQFYAQSPNFVLPDGVTREKLDLTSSFGALA